MKELTGFARTAASVAATGFARATPADLAERLSICAQCASHDPDHDRCRACGCKLSLKAGFAGSDCPLGRWPEPVKRGAEPRMTTDSRRLERG